MPIVLPQPPATKLSPAEAGAVATRARKLLRAGRISHRTHVLLDCLLWSCRNPATGAITVSFGALQRLAHMARATVAAGLGALEQVGLLTRIRRRVRVSWVRGGHASRQATNSYILHPPADTEFSSRTVHKKIELIHIRQDNGLAVEAQAALAAIRGKRRALLCKVASGSRLRDERSFLGK
jgi:hypothetical protein